MFGGSIDNPLLEFSWAYCCQFFYNLPFVTYIIFSTKIANKTVNKSTKHKRGKKKKKKNYSFIITDVQEISFLHRTLVFG